MSVLCFQKQYKGGQLSSTETSKNNTDSSRTISVKNKRKQTPRPHVSKRAMRKYNLLIVTTFYCFFSFLEEKNKSLFL